MITAAPRRDRSVLWSIPKAPPASWWWEESWLAPNALEEIVIGDDLALAVDPHDPNKVYLVWGDLVNGRVSLHVKYSTDSGKTWLDGKRDIPNAKNPGLAVNSDGTVGFLYQQVVISRTDICGG